MSHNRKGAEARVRRGIENHAIAFYKAVKKSHAENEAYEERIKDHKEYNRLYNDAQKEDFRMRRSYLRHKVEEAKRALFMSIESELGKRLETNETPAPTMQPTRTIPPWKNGPDFNNYRFESNGKLIDRKVVSELNGFPVADYIDVNTGESLNLTTEEMIVLPVGVWIQLEADPPLPNP